MLNACSNQNGARLYNRAVAPLPELGVRPFLGEVDLDYSRHAQRACISDRYGVIRPPFHLHIKPEYLVEVEVVGNRAQKAVVRIPHNQDKDLVLVLLAPERGIAKVKTVWLNEASDCHASLDKSVFAN